MRIFSSSQTPISLKIIGTGFAFWLCMDSIFSAIQSEFSDLPSLEITTRLVLRLLLAGILGGILGFEREAKGKSAGLRTHVMLAMGTAFFIMVPKLSGMQEDAISRILQGLLTGVGFIGAGTILKHTDEGRIEGLTTPAGLWFHAAIGVAAGMGMEMSAIMGSLIGFLILNLVPHISNLSKRKTSSLIALDSNADKTEEQKSA